MSERRRSPDTSAERERSPVHADRLYISLEQLLTPRGTVEQARRASSPRMARSSGTPPRQSSRTPSRQPSPRTEPHTVDLAQRPSPWSATGWRSATFERPECLIADAIFASATQCGICQSPVASRGLCGHGLCACCLTQFSSISALAGASCDFCVVCDPSIMRRTMRAASFRGRYVREIVGSAQGIAQASARHRKVSRSGGRPPRPEDSSQRHSTHDEKGEMSRRSKTRSRS